MDVEKSAVVFFERKEVEMVDFNNTYRFYVPVAEMCEVALRGEGMEEEKDFTYLGRVLHKHGEME